MLAHVAAQPHTIDLIDCVAEKEVSTGRQQVSVFGQESEDMLNREIMRCEALLESESDRSKCKWPILTLARLLELRCKLTSQQTGTGEGFVYASCSNCCGLSGRKSSSCKIRRLIHKMHAMCLQGCKKKGLTSS